MSQKRLGIGSLDVHPFIRISAAEKGVKVEAITIASIDPSKLDVCASQEGGGGGGGGEEETCRFNSFFFPYRMKRVTYGTMRVCPSCLQPATGLQTIPFQEQERG